MGCYSIATVGAGYGNKNGSRSGSGSLFFSLSSICRYCYISRTSRQYATILCIVDQRADN